MRNKKAKVMNRVGVKWNVAFNILLIISALTVIIPMALLVIVSFSSTKSIDTIGYTFTPLEWSLEGYSYVFKTGSQLVDSYLVTIALSVVGTVLGLVVMSLYAYVLCQRRFWLCRPLTWYLFFTMLFSGGLVPSYILNTRVYNLDDTFWILVLPGLVGASNVIILRTFIKTTIPETLFEAARIDGACHFRIFFNIVLPLYKAGLGVVGLFTFVAKWNEWFTGMLYIQNPKLVPIQTMLTKLQKNVDFIKSNSEVASTPEGMELIKSMPSDNLRMAITVLVVAPIVFAYPFFQRYFVSGLTVGSIKE